VEIKRFILTLEVTASSLPSGAEKRFVGKKYGFGRPRGIRPLIQTKKLVNGLAGSHYVSLLLTHDRAEFWSLVSLPQTANDYTYLQ